MFFSQHYKLQKINKEKIITAKYTTYAVAKRNAKQIQA